MKQRVKEEASRDPDRFFPTGKMKEMGLMRRTCPKCGTFFWSADAERTLCGEPACLGGYSFIGRKSCKHRMDFIGVWKRFSELFSSRGYTPIKRYPSISRWNSTSEFTLASITDFQPYVVRGAVKPPANPLVVPQTCLRFNDVDNVGITGRHNTGFIMIGQHAFEPERSFDQDRYFEDIHAWLVEGMGIPLTEIVYHEDAWAGGGNFGCSLEFFSGGLEIGNQVYTMYERDGDSLKGLDIRVLDMGMGQERPAWFSHGTPTSYEPNFPTVMERLFKIAGIGPEGEEKELMMRFLPYSGLLNLEEVDDIDKVWADIAERIGAEEGLLRRSVMINAALYSIADHARGLLFALTDGGLPSNSGGGYNLRLIYRRAMNFIEKYGWNLDMGDVCHWHAEYLKPQFPEMLDSLSEVREIIDHERGKFLQTREKARSTVIKLKEKEMRGQRVSVDDLIMLYDSQGITPDLMLDSGLDVSVPPDFYARVSALHEATEPSARTGKEFQYELSTIPETKILYYDDYLMVEFESEVMAVIEDNVILKATAFYPTSGGQLHDIGSLHGPSDLRVTEVFKQDRVILHKVSGDLSKWSAGTKARGHIDEERRRQLAQHHTSTHIINGVAKSILGGHIWQAGAEKTEEKGRLDITHYESLSPSQLESIEERANEIISSSLPVRSMVLAKDEAERRFGFRLYQGGAVPGETLRIIDIDGLDTEACGGTHLKNTSEAVRIILLGTKKIQDGIVRIEYVAGKRARDIYESDLDHLLRAMAVLSIDDPHDLVSACERVFNLWKTARKLRARIRSANPDSANGEKEDALVILRGDPAYPYLESYRKLGRPTDIGGVDPNSVKKIMRPHEYVTRAAQSFKVQKEHLGKTILRFLSETDSFEEDIQR
ncbi:MAG: alanine--tRNA ligase [Candidatus Thermoplasmatota archaeon]|nr:alanine--tRNA ligase [Candidatus Thermoplasmatota archaeon]